MAISVATKSLTKDEIVSLLDPFVAEWFSQFPDITPPQRYAIINIHERNNTLIASPTGSGKTLAAFLSIINELVRLGREGKLVVADLHLGLADEQESKGVHIPTTTLPKILESILVPAREYGCSKVILLGDVKHEFGRPSEPEWYAVRKLIKAVRENWLRDRGRSRKPR